MPQVIPISELKIRAERIGLTPQALAQAAGVDPTTVYEAYKGRNIRMRTWEWLTESLFRAERALFDYLAALHPDWLAAAAAGGAPGVDPAAPHPSPDPAPAAPAALEAAE